MAYITNNDLIRRVGSERAIQLTTDPPATEEDSTVLDAVRLQSEGEINSYLAPRYTVPVDLSAHPDVQATVQAFCLDIAEHRLHRRRPPVPEDTSKAYQSALEWLRRVAKGEVLLPAETAPSSTPDTHAYGSGSPRLDSDEGLAL